METEKQTATSGKPGSQATMVVGVAILLANIIFIINAARQGGWGAMGWMLMVSPVFNGLMLAIGLVRGIILESRHPGRGHGAHWLVCVVMPVLLALLGILLLFTGVISTGNGGC